MASISILNRVRSSINDFRDRVVTGGGGEEGIWSRGGGYAQGPGGEGEGGGEEASDAEQAQGVGGFH